MCNLDFNTYLMFLKGVGLLSCGLELFELGLLSFGVELFGLLSLHTLDCILLENCMFCRRVCS